MIGHGVGKCYGCYTKLASQNAGCYSAHQLSDAGYSRDIGECIAKDWQLLRSLDRNRLDLRFLNFRMLGNVNYCQPG